MARQATIIETIVDYRGDYWDVRERRATVHGFDVCFGWPTSNGESQRGQGGDGGPRMIPTPELVEYWRKCGIDRNGSIYDLPASRTAIKHLRRSLGLNFYVAYNQWWDDHLTDLRALTRAQFARKYEIDPVIVGIQRKKHLAG